MCKPDGVPFCRVLGWISKPRVKIPCQTNGQENQQDTHRCRSWSRAAHMFTSCIRSIRGQILARYLWNANRLMKYTPPLRMFSLSGCHTAQLHRLCSLPCALQVEIKSIQINQRFKCFWFGDIVSSFSTESSGTVSFYALNSLFGLLLVLALSNSLMLRCQDSSPQLSPREAFYREQAPGHDQGNAVPRKHVPDKGTGLTQKTPSSSATPQTSTDLGDSKRFISASAETSSATAAAPRVPHLGLKYSLLLVDKSTGARPSLGCILGP